MKLKQNGLNERRDKLFKKAIQEIQYPQWLDSRKTCQKYSQELNQIC